jgi:3-hydroxybutyryl-CoA dehydratase
MKIGDAAELTRTFTRTDVEACARWGGPPSAHVPEPLIGALFSRLLGVDLPGPGTNYLKQRLDFIAPAPVGAPLTARVTVTRLRPEKHLADLETVCTLADGRVVARGRALVYVADVGRANRITGSP